jgi:L-alanine-DL-glutamate epimerase-like enolase superfamily enzyme
MPQLKKNVPKGMLVTTGEHEATRWGFRMLMEMDCCDIIQPDVGWCGGVTELVKISALADARARWSCRTAPRSTAIISSSPATIRPSPNS